MSTRDEVYICNDCFKKLQHKGSPFIEEYLHICFSVKNNRVVLLDENYETNTNPVVKHLEKTGYIVSSEVGKSLVRITAKSFIHDESEYYCVSGKCVDRKEDS